MLEHSPTYLEVPFMAELPQELPSLVYNSLVCGLGSALAWHAINLITAIVKRAYSSKD
jgi:hypothetical protein